QDLVHVPFADVEQMSKEGAHFRHGHQRFFFPPIAPAGASGTRALKVRASCDDASPPIRASHTRPSRTLPWPTVCPPRWSIVTHAPEPALTAAHLMGRLSGGTLTRALDPTSVAPAIAHGDQAIPLR